MTTETGFDRFLRKKLRDPSFRDEYEAVRAEIDAADALVRANSSGRRRIRSLRGT